MYSEPHKLYLVIPGKSVQDEDGNMTTLPGGTTFLCGCHRHDISTKEMEGLNGKGIKALHKINLDRRNLNLGDIVEVRELNEDFICRGAIVDIKKTSGMPMNYMSIFI